MKKLNRSRKDWADTTARGVLSGSFAQSQNVLIMALEDIQTLHAEIKSREDNAHDFAREYDRMTMEAMRLKAKVAELEAECFKLAAGVCEYRSGDDHGNPLCLMVRKNIPPNMYLVASRSHATEDKSHDA